ncbi:MAG: Eco57I restriction-modification methylase domain-containing protein [Nitrososphaerota archaeon]
MNKEQAKNLIIETFENKFNEEQFTKFISNLLKTYDKNCKGPWYGNYIPEPYRGFIESYKRLGRYNVNNDVIDILIIYLKRGYSLEKARVKQRNFVAGYLKGKWGSKSLKDAAICAFVSSENNCADWRFSLVKLDYKYEETSTGKIKIIDELTPAKRWSFLVGVNEKSHTAQSRFIDLIENEDYKPSLKDLEEKFNVEKVTKEFFDKYRDLFIKIKLELDKLLRRDRKLKEEFENKNIDTVNFTKKLLGQIIFLYFLQKKGWFGVEKNKNWGTGPKDFIRKLFNKEYCDYKNFYNDILEPLFYEALRTDRRFIDHYYSRFNCKIPFLNGGLFDPINNFDWIDIDILIPNEIFSNKNKTPEGDIGDGVLDIFDRYNFTVNEEEPLEKEVALDPELLGKIYEKLNAIRPDNFDEYVRVLKSGKRGEETKFNKEYGVFYTPREIVQYMCQESLINYLEIELNGEVLKEDIEKFVKTSDHLLEYEKVSYEKEQKINNGEQKETKYESRIPESIKIYAEKIDKLLENIKVCDPAVGSGAFPVSMMHEILKLRKFLSIYLNREINNYDLKRHCINHSLYGVDIDPGAVEICKLRLWLSLIVDEEDFYQIKPLPNLDYKIICGDSLLGIERSVEKNFFNNIAYKKLIDLINKQNNETNPDEKIKLKKEIDRLIFEISNGHKEFDFYIYFPEVFSSKNGFDIVIANPPYVSTKGVPEDYKKLLKKYYGFEDDLYNHFYFKGLEICKDNGILTYISSKTYWTILTKKNLRELLLKNKIIQIYDTGNPFEAPMVDTSVIIIQKSNDNNKNNKIIFIDGKEDLTNPKKFEVYQGIYNNTPNKVIFIPTEYNLKIYEKILMKTKDLLDKWWDKIKTSRDIEKNKNILENYRKNLKPGDITLLGLITKGGVGLQTGDNGKYIGVLEGTKWAEKVKKERIEKLWEFINSKKPNELSHLNSKQEVENYLNKLTEKEIRNLFDNLKEKYGKDIFGQGWLYRIVSKEEIADVDTLTDEEKLNGIEDDKTFVPYDKGDKEGNRWYAPTPYYIDWSRRNVENLKNDPKARWQGYEFFFREGLCWSDIHTVNIKCRIKTKGVHDVKSMSLFSLDYEKYPEYFLICLLNSSFISDYVFSFIKNTQTFQINDAKVLPIIIPSTEKLKEFEKIFNKAYDIQKQKFEGKISEKEAEKKLNSIQKELDEEIEKLYSLNK